MKVTTASALVAAVAIALPAHANAGSFMGVVLANQSHRHALVLARASGAGLTVRTSARARLGDRLEVRGLRLSDLVTAGGGRVRNGGVRSGWIVLGTSGKR